jgi:hypothetical protein
MNAELNNGQRDPRDLIPHYVHVVCFSKMLAGGVSIQTTNLQTSATANSQILTFFTLRAAGRPLGAVDGC